MSPIHPSLRILVIEDDPALTATIAEILSAAGTRTFAVATAATLEAGLVRLADEEYDIVLLDLNLPDSSGLATLKRLLPACAVPVVVMTGHGDEEMGIFAMQAGAQDYLAKGHFDGVDLVRTLVYAIERGQLRTAEVFAVLRVLRSEFKALRADFHDVKGLLGALSEASQRSR